MALSKIQAESMNLADTYAFSGTVSGSGMNLLLNDTISSAVAQYDISSTYINSTYDSYFLETSLAPADDGEYLYMRVFVDGSVVTSGSQYGYETQRIGGAYSTGGFNNNATSTFVLTHGGVGNAAGEAATSQVTIQNVNSTTHPFSVTGLTSWGSAYAASGNTTFGGSLIPASYASVVNGLRFWFSSGNIANGTVRLYGLRK